MRIGFTLMSNDEYMTSDGTLIQVRKRLRDQPPIYIEQEVKPKPRRPIGNRGSRKDFGEVWPKRLATVRWVLGARGVDLLLDEESIELYRKIYQAIWNKTKSFRTVRSDRAILHAKSLGLHFIATYESINVVLTQEQIEALQVLVKNRVK